jgi:ABC-type multidrug transport system fused ATPase/permease subunit
MSTGGGGLPVATIGQAKVKARQLLRLHRGAFLVVLALNAGAALCGLVGPQVLGRIVEDVHRRHAPIDTLALVFAGCLVVQALLTRWARYRAMVLGEQVLAQLREELLTNVVSLPLGTVEQAGTGDLLTRTTSDVDELAYSVRFAVPEIGVALVGGALTITAAALTNPLLAPPCLIMVPALWWSTRWYLKRAPRGYLHEMAEFSKVNAAIHEAVDGARTIEALRLGPRRIARTERQIGRWIGWERYTLYLRTVWFPTVEVSYMIPAVATLLAGGYLHAHGWATLGEVTAVTLYVQQLIDPVDRLLSWLDELQLGGTSMARLIGVAMAGEGAADGTDEPEGERIVAREVRFAYAEDRDVLHGISLDVKPGERIAMVGPSGAGKSTLGRLLAGIHAPRRGSVTVGGTEIASLDPTRVRRHVALVTQEHHVFVGTVADNLRLAAPAATDADLRSALASVDALDWVLALPDGLDTKVGSGGQSLTPAQAQQVALARLVLADPHTLVLDEATSLIDPRAARHLERSLAAVLEGRTVIAIAHRLHTAHDADRVAVVEDGQIAELGSHHDLLAAGGSYAHLWKSWQS